MNGPERATLSAARRDLLLLVGSWALTAAAYALGAELGLGLALVNDQVSPLWPPTGIALAALFLTGGRAWPGITLGAFIVNVALAPSLAAAAAITVGNTAAPVLAWRLLRWRDFHTDLSRLHDVFSLVALGALSAMLVSATVGTSALVLAGAVPSARFASVWWVWWTGDATGVLVVAPFLLVLCRRWRREDLTGWWPAETALVSTATALVSIVVFRSHLQLLFPVFPLLVWGSLRLKQYGAAPTALITAVIATWYAAHPQGPFADLALTRRMVLLLAVNGCVAVTAYLLAAMTSEWQASQAALSVVGADLEGRVAARTAELSKLVAELEVSEQRAEEAQGLAHIGSWEWDMAADEVTWSDEVFRLYGKTRPDRPMTYGDFIEAVHPEDRNRVGVVIERAYRQVEPYSVEHRVVHADSSVHWIQGRGRVIADAYGVPIRITGTAQDIDDRLMAEQATLQLTAVAERRRQALEVNDDIVQGLVAAQFALSLGQQSRAQVALDATLRAARQIVAELWGEHTSGSGPQAGDLVRGIPAQLGSRATQPEGEVEVSHDR